MKQHITIEQLNELSKNGQEKLKEWWKPQLDHIVAYKNYDQGVPLYLVVDNDMRSGWSFDQAMEGVIVLPLLSIGQMIEFLDEHNHFSPKGNIVGIVKEYVGSDEYWWGLKYEAYNDKMVMNSDKELCDALWEAVKEVLQDEKKT